jgi:integrase
LEIEDAMRVQLTDRFCASAKSTEAQTDYFDATISGLALRVTSGGTKSWSLLHGTPRRRVGLGRYPSLSLAAARARAIEVKDGRSAGTVAALAEVYLRSIQGLRSVGQIERRLRKDVLPIIGHIQLHELHRRDVTRVIDAKLLDAPITARRVFEDIRAMIRWSVARGDIDHNPIDGMKGPPISKPRTRVLSDDEIRALWQALDEFKPEVARVIKLCLLTGQRIGEVAGMISGELDLTRKVWNIPGSRTKNGHPHSVPLSQLALDIINQADGLRIDQAHVSSIIHYNQFGLARRWTAHDCRRTALTKMAELGIAPIVLGHVANHRTTTKAGITLGVYVQHAYEKEKREALELWADRLQGIISGGAEVVSIGSKR